MFLTLLIITPGQAQETRPQRLLVEMTMEKLLAVFSGPDENVRRWFWKPQNTLNFCVQMILPEENRSRA